MKLKGFLWGYRGDSRRQGDPRNILQFGSCTFLYHTGASRRRLPTLLKGHGLNEFRFEISQVAGSTEGPNESKSQLFRRWERIVAVLGVDAQIRTLDLDDDSAIGPAAWLGRVPQGVLIPSIPDGAGVGLLNAILGEFGID